MKWIVWAPRGSSTGDVGSFLALGEAHSADVLQDGFK